MCVDTVTGILQAHLPSVALYLESLHVGVLTVVITVILILAIAILIQQKNTILQHPHFSQDQSAKNHLLMTLTQTGIHAAYDVVHF